MLDDDDEQKMVLDELDDELLDVDDNDEHKVLLDDVMKLHIVEIIILSIIVMLPDENDTEHQYLDDIIITLLLLLDDDDIIDDEYNDVWQDVECLIEVDEADMYDELLIELHVIENILSHHHLDEQKLDIIDIDA